MISLSEYIRPGATIGIVGGGQLGQMLGSAAVSMGFTVVVLDPTPDCPAARVASRQIVADYDDEAALAELAASSDVLTYEFENVSAAALRNVSALTEVPQGVGALQICQDRLAEKAFLGSAGVPIAEYRPVPSPAELGTAVEEVGYPCVLKTTRGGYDGKGQVVLRAESDLEAATALAGSAECVLEAWVPFQMEISVIVAGNPQGQYVCFPVGENIHRHNILHQTIVPARVSEQVADRALVLAEKIARQIGLVGVMGIEMFVGADGELFINELAPRPHNSGHYTIEACDYSQFEAHIRGVCGWPLRAPRLLSPVVMANVLGEHLDATLAAIPAWPDGAFHLYGKSGSKTGRKMGHVTVLAKDQESALQQCADSEIWFT